MIFYFPICSYFWIFFCIFAFTKFLKCLDNVYFRCISFVFNFSLSEQPLSLLFLFINLYYHFLKIKKKNVEKNPMMRKNIKKLLLHFQFYSYTLRVNSLLLIENDIHRKSVFNIFFKLKRKDYYRARNYRGKKS